MACTLGHRRGLGRCAALRRCVRVRVAQPPSSFTTPSAATFYARNALVSGDHFTQNQAERLLQVFPTMKDVANKDHISRVEVTMKNHISRFEETMKDHISRVEVTMKDHISRFEETMKDHISRFEETMKDHISRVEATMEGHISRVEATMKTGFVEQQKFFVLLALAFPVLVAIFLALIFGAITQFPVDPSSVVGLLISKNA